MHATDGNPRTHLHGYFTATRLYRRLLQEVIPGWHGLVGTLLLAAYSRSEVSTDILR